jgi:hypothetical protein
VAVAGPLAVAPALAAAPRVVAATGNRPKGAQRIALGARCFH